MTKCKKTGRSCKTRKSRSERQFLRKKEVIARRAAKFSLRFGKKKSALKKRHVDGKFTGDRIIWNKEMQKHCEVGCEDVETSEVQENRIKKCKTDGDRHVTEEGKVAAITDDQELQTRAKTTKFHRD